ncbi:MAG: glycosyltransferase [Clostridia bacterium]|nr:glycosyltransferase [Clostridia bacterium]
MKSNGRVFYVCFYCEPEVEGKIITYPSVISKIDYVSSSIKRLGKEVVLVSIAPSINGEFKGYESTIDGKEKHIYLPSTNSKNKIVQKLNFLLHNRKITKFLEKNIKENDTILVYHSLYNRMWLKKINKKYPDKVVLQIEDVFSEISEKTKKFNEIEWKLFKQMKKCICVNDIIIDDLKCVPQKMVSYGSYNLPKKYNVEKGEKIKLVYAGVIEQERKAAFLAIDAMEHLTDDYELHILGFGTDENIKALEERIEQVNNQKNCKSITFHGKKTGEEYWKFLQGCDIALSTHSYDEKSFASADYTFPSKILTYLANNLRVVAQKLQVLEKSAVSEYITFYDEPNSILVADAIKSININDIYDSRKLIDILNNEFLSNIEKLL